MTMRHKLQIINFFSQILPSARRLNCARSRARTFILVSIKLVHAIHAPVPTLFITTPVSALEKVPLLGGGGPQVFYHKKYSVGFLEYAKGEVLCWGVNFCRLGFNWIISLSAEKGARCVTSRKRLRKRERCVTSKKRLRGRLLFTEINMFLANPDI